MSIFFPVAVYDTNRINRNARLLILGWETQVCTSALLLTGHVTLDKPFILSLSLSVKKMASTSQPSWWSCEVNEVISMHRLEGLDSLSAYALSSIA